MFDNCLFTPYLYGINYLQCPRCDAMMLVTVNDSALNFVDLYNE
jgi:hypothetical protein